jgi:D-alanyl-D-alanine carboxypeptidase
MPSGFSIGIKTQAKAAILVDAKTGKVLFEKNAHSPLPPASTTKVATICYALTKVNEEHFHQLIEAPPEVLQGATKTYKKKVGYKCKPYLLEPDGTTAEVRKLEKLSLKTLFYGIMLASGNDAANVLAHHLGEKQVEKFMIELNRYLKGLGCQKTTLKNPHGLHYPGHLTTAYDLSIVAKEAMKNKFFRELVSTKVSIRPKSNKSEEKMFTQPNRLLIEGNFFYPFATGIKTGYTEDAGYCLVASAENKERSLIVVILGSPSTQERYSDAIELFNQAFDEEKFRQKIYDVKDAKFTFTHPKAKKNFQLGLKEDVFVEYFPSNKPKVSSKLILAKTNPPYNLGQSLGSIEIYLDEELVGIKELFAEEAVGLKGHLVLINLFKAHFVLVSFFFLGINFALYLLIKNRKYFISIFRRKNLRA